MKIRIPLFLVSFLLTSTLSFGQDSPSQESPTILADMSVTRTSEWVFPVQIKNSFQFQLRANSSHINGKWILNGLTNIQFHIVIQSSDGKPVFDKWVKDTEIVELSNLIKSKGSVLTIKINNVKYDLPDTLMTNPTNLTEEQRQLLKNPRISGILEVKTSSDQASSFVKTSVCPENELLEPLLANLDAVIKRYSDKTISDPICQRQLNEIKEQAQVLRSLIEKRSTDIQNDPSKAISPDAKAAK